MKFTIEISEEDYEAVRDTVMTVEEMYETVQGRIYRAIVDGRNVETTN